tara:strand:+ start:157 stop:486 length:330 start_codon:yes stop_codon:yes gene_type:complete
MKLLLVLMLTFSIFTDFASPSFFEDVSFFHVESSITCDDSDIHDSGSEESHSHHEEEHHCHVGHFHHVVCNDNDTDISPSKTEILVSFPAFQFGNVQSFSTDINRPPIS